MYNMVGVHDSCLNIRARKSVSPVGIALAVSDELVALPGGNTSEYTSCTMDWG